MALLNAQVVLKVVTGIPADHITNTWHFDDDEDPANWAVIAGLLEDFYDTLRPQMSAWCVQNGHEIKMYRISDPEPRAPIYTTSFNLTVAPAGTMLPPEVAAVLSFQAAQVSGQPQARRRGRIYFGPLATTTVGSDGLFTSTFYLALANAAKVILDASQLSTTWKWATYSTVDQAGYNVDNGWVNNECDTQRRRSRLATVRSTFI
jgi:hypothetical protein